MPFEYPNLLMGTRSAKGWTIGAVSGAASVNSSGGIIRSNTRSSENFIFSPSVVLNKGIDYTLHCFAANTPNLISTAAWVLDDAGYSDSYEWIGAYLKLNKPGPGGGWLDATFRLNANARDGAKFKIRFDNDGSADGKECFIWFRDVMLTEGTEPHAWAPASGEVWPE